MTRTTARCWRRPCVVILCVAAGAAATFAAERDRPLRVITHAVAPFVLPKTDPPAGFSIDLWNEVAQRMRSEFTWIVARPDVDLLQAVQRGDADVAIAAIVMTPEAEKVVDLSHPYFDSGLQIMVRAQEENPFLATVRSIPWVVIGQLFAAAMALVFFLAIVLSVVERRRNKDFATPYWRAVGEGVWGTMLIIATGEHGERTAPGVVKRVFVVLTWLLGIVLVAQLTATVTSTQTVQRLRSSIQGPDDLPGKTIASVPGSVAADYLTQHRLPFVGVTYGPDALRMLAEGQVQALVFDAPTLLYWAAAEGHGAVQVVGPIFRAEKYAIAVGEGSALRKPINEALLEIFNDGTYEKLYAKWFSRGK